MKAAPFVTRDAGMAKISHAAAARIISDVQKLLAAGNRRAGLTDEERELLARGLTFIRGQGRRRQPQLQNVIVLRFGRLRPVGSDRYHSAAATEVTTHQIAAQSPRDAGKMIRADTRSGKRSGSRVGPYRRESQRCCARSSQNTALVSICFFQSALA